MVSWDLAVFSVIIGTVLGGLFGAIGWFFKKGEQERRDAAHITNIIYEDTKTKTETEREGIRKDLVRMYGEIFRDVKKEWKKK